MLRSRSVVAAAVVALAVAAVGGAELASVVPEDAVVYVEVNDPAGVWGDFEESGLRDMIRAVPQVEMGFQLATGFVPKAANDQFGIQWKDFVEKFGSRVAVVVTEEGGPGRVPVFLLNAAKTKAELGTLLKETVEATLKGKVPGVRFADELYQEVALRLMNGPNGALGYGFIGDALALGEPAAVKKLIEGKARRPLTANEAFLKVSKALAVPKGVVAYLNLGRVVADHKPFLDANAEMARGLDAIGLTTAKWVAFASAFDGRGVRDRVYLFTGERKIGIVNLLGSLTPGATEAATVLPKECPLLVSLTFKDGPELWQAILKFIEAIGDPQGLARVDEGRHNVLLQFGINFDEEVIGSLGGEVFLAANPDFVAEFAAKRKLPTNEDFAFIIGCRVAKAEALKATVHKFIASQPIMGQGVERKADAYQGVEVNVLTIPGKESKPAYAFVGDYLLIAKSEAIIRQCIDAKAKGEGLAASPRFRNVAEKVPPKHSLFVYADIESLFVAAAKGEKPGAEGEPGRVFEQLAGQLRGAAATIASEKEGVLVEAYTRPGILPLVGAVVVWLPRPGPPVEPGVQPPAEPGAKPPGAKPADF